MKFSEEVILNHYEQHQEFEDALGAFLNEFYHEKYYPYFDKMVRSYFKEHTYRYNLGYDHALNRGLNYSHINNNSMNQPLAIFQGDGGGGETDTHEIPLWYFFVNNDEWQEDVIRLIKQEVFKKFGDPQENARKELATIEKRAIELKKMLEVEKPYKD